jgi:hypothetical protein
MRPYLALVFALLLGCSDSGRRHGGGPGGDGDGGNDGNGDAGAAGLGCSADLQSITNSDGTVRMTCPPDQGCAGGQCVPACDAAAMSKGNVGCSFAAATPAFYPSITPPCFAVFLANNWGKDVKISVSRGGMSYDATLFARIATGSSSSAATWPTLPATGLPPGQVAVLFLSSDPTSENLSTPLRCPVPQAVMGGTAVAGTAKGQAFTITTDAPVSAYDILPYGGAASFLPAAELLLPTTAWGTNYVAALPPNQAGGAQGGPQWGQIIAAEDGTSVMINPTHALPAGGGLPAAAVGVVTTFSLNAGEYIQWEDSGEMSGSVVSSSKPVAFVGGTGYLCITSMTSPGGGGCDSGHQMIPPVSALGSEYAAAPFVTRRASLLPESIPYRFVGAVDGTMLSYDPPITAAPAKLGRGVVVDFETTTPFVVKSQDASHPFYVAQLMPGCLLSDGSRPGQGGSPFGSGGLGDEEFVNLLPPAQFLSKYVFFTDPTYSTTNLVLTRVKHNGVFEDVTLDCAGTIGGWMPLGGGDAYEYAQIDLWRAKMSVNGCSNGPHTAQSNGRFGLVVWGTDSYASYAYPGGGNLGTISTAVVIP